MIRDGLNWQKLMLSFSKLQVNVVKDLKWLKFVILLIQAKSGLFAILLCMKTVLNRVNC